MPDISRFGAYRSAYYQYGSATISAGDSPCLSDDGGNSYIGLYKDGNLVTENTTYDIVANNMVLDSYDFLFDCIEQSSSDAYVNIQLICVLVENRDWYELQNYQEVARSTLDRYAINNFAEDLVTNPFPNCYYTETIRVPKNTYYNLNISQLLKSGHYIGKEFDLAAGQSLDGNEIFARIYRNVDLDHVAISGIYDRTEGQFIGTYPPASVADGNVSILADKSKTIAFAITRTSDEVNKRKVRITVNAGMITPEQANFSGIYVENFGTRVYEVYAGELFYLDIEEFHSITSYYGARKKENGDPPTYTRVRTAFRPTEDMEIYLMWMKVKITLYAGCYNVDNIQHTIPGDVTPDGYVEIYGTRVFEVEKGETVILNPGEFHPIDDLYYGFYRYSSRGRNSVPYSTSRSITIQAHESDENHYAVWGCSPVPTMTITVKAGCCNFRFIPGRGYVLVNNNGIFDGNFVEEYGTRTYEIKNGESFTANETDFYSGDLFCFGIYCIGRESSSGFTISKPSDGDVYYLVWSCTDF